MNKTYIVLLSLITSTGIMAMEQEVKKVQVSSDNVKAMCALIYKQAKADNFNPALLVGITRGGLLPSYILGGEPMFNNRNVTTVAVESYDEKDQQKELSLLFPIHFEDFKHFKSILIIDDLVDSGKTVDFVVKLFKKEMPEDTTIKVAALYYKKKSIVVPDYYAEETTDWIVFPSEA